MKEKNQGAGQPPQEGRDVSDTPWAIETENLSYAYPVFENEEPVMVLKNFSLQIKKGSFVAILGHNGSGKSTLARLLNAQMMPTEGRIRILGMDTREEAKLWDIRSRCGMVFQNPDNQMVASIVEEDVAFGPENLGIPNPELRNRVDFALDAVDMSPYKKRATHELSGGQKQRVAIAGVLAMKPDCLVMDEPTAMLDPIGRREILETIDFLNHQQKMTILLITHNMEEAVHADRIVVLNDGEIALDGSPREVFSRVSLMRNLELDVPQATELSYLLHEAGYEIPGDLLTVREVVEALL